MRQKRTLFGKGDKNHRLMMKLLVTGGLGYLGSHFCVCALQEGYDLMVLDDLSLNPINQLKNIEFLAGKSLVFQNVNLNDKDKLLGCLKKQSHIDAVVHFAAIKDPVDSIINPLKYYQNNVVASLNLLQGMLQNDIKKLIFSSTAAVYANVGNRPIREDMLISPYTPYGKSKWFFEEMLKDICEANPDFSAVSLRYFNAAGAHPSGLIGEKILQKGSRNIIPEILKAADIKINSLPIFGKDYPTIDGTPVRDYVHVIDLAKGHLKGLNYVENYSGFNVFNLGKGTGTSILELIKKFEHVNNIPIPYHFASRRKGDLPIVYADISRAQNVLNWQPLLHLRDILKDAWNFYTKHHH